MQYRVKLAQADVINMNNRCYTKECLEQIKDQINKKSVAVAKEITLNDQIGKTIKAEIIDDCLYADIVLFKPISTKFINLAILGRIETNNTAKKLWNGGEASGVQYINENDMQYDTVHYEIKDPEIKYLFASNTNSFSKDNFKTSNFVKKQITFNNEWIEKNVDVNSQLEKYNKNKNI